MFGSAFRLPDPYTTQGRWGSYFCPGSKPKALIRVRNQKDFQALYKHTWLRLLAPQLYTSSDASAAITKPDPAAAEATGPGRSIRTGVDDSTRELLGTASSPCELNPLYHHVLEDNGIIYEIKFRATIDLPY